MGRLTVATVALVVILLTSSHFVWARQPVPSNRTIVPGVRVGEIALGMSKDDVLRRLGKPQVIYYLRKKYTLDNLPDKYGMEFGHMRVFIIDDAVRRIDVQSPSSH